MSEFKIEKNVPLPAGPPPEMPFGEMAIGDSFVVTLKRPADRAAIRQRIVRFQKASFPKRLSMRKVDENTVRIYRVKNASRPKKEKK